MVDCLVVYLFIYKYFYSLLRQTVIYLTQKSIVNQGREMVILKKDYSEKMAGNWKIILLTTRTIVSAKEKKRTLRKKIRSQRKLE